MIHLSDGRAVLDRAAPDRGDHRRDGCHCHGYIRDSRAAIAPKQSVNISCFSRHVSHIFDSSEAGSVRALQRVTRRILRQEGHHEPHPPFN